MPWSIDKDTALLLSASSLPSRFGVTVYNGLFRRLDINALYLWREAKEAGPLIDAMRTLRIKGASISMPLKRQVIEHLDEVEPSAAEVQSVNTVVDEDGRLVGYNTDMAGAAAVLAKIEFERALIYGSGSVVDSLACVLRRLGKGASLRARNLDRVRSKCERWNLPLHGEEAFDLFINATPLSLESLSPDVLDLLKTRPKVFDLVVPRRDNFLDAHCAQNELEYVPGFAMYQGQFVRQFELYTGHPIEPELVRRVASERGLI